MREGGRIPIREKENMQLNRVIPDELKFSFLFLALFSLKGRGLEGWVFFLLSVFLLTNCLDKCNAETYGFS